LDDALNNFALVGDVTAPMVPGAAAQFKLKVDGSADVAFDPDTQTYHFTSMGVNGKQTTVWLGTSASLRHRLQQIEKYRVRGVTVRGLMSAGNDTGIPAVLSEYQAQRLNTTSAPASLQVSIQLNTVAATRTPNQASVNGTTVEVQMPKEPGEYLIQTKVNGTTTLNTRPERVQVAEP
jgi:spore germination protein YaaH